MRPSAPTYRRRAPRRLLALAAAIVFAMLHAAAAHAATATVSGAVLNYTADGAQVNAVSVSFLAGSYTVSDPGAAITPGAGCSTITASSVSCNGAGVTSLTVEARDLADAVNLSSTVTVATTVNGGEGNDILQGGAGADTLSGGTDDDELTGGAGNDTLNGDTGDDTLDGQTGADSLNGHAGTDLVTYASRVAPVVVDIDASADDGELGEADNVKTDVERLTGGQGNDGLVGSTAANTLLGGPGADSLDGIDANDILDGGPGPDVLTGGAGTDTARYADRVTPVVVDIDGAADDGESGELDTVEVDVENIDGGSAADVLTGSDAANQLMGGGGADQLTGGDAADTLVGGAGGDTFDGGRGGDALQGDDGVDTVDYSARSATVTADADGVADDGEAAEADNVKPDVENITGGSDADVLTGSKAANRLDGGDGADVLNGLNGADTMIGGDGMDTVDYSSRTLPVTVDPDGLADDGESGEGDTVAADVENLTGGAGNDRLTGEAGPNVLSGNSGNDVLDGGSGPDLLAGGAGEDTADYSGRATAVVVDLDGDPDDGEPGEDDNVATDVENIRGGGGSDQLAGSTLANRFWGGGGADTMMGGDGNDVLLGETGDDSIEGANGNDIQDGGNGADDISGSDGDDVLDGSVGDDVVRGGDDDDEILGSTGDDRLEGGRDQDRLSGGDGADTLEGGGNDDEIGGDAGADVLRGDAGNDSIAGDTGADTIDGSAGDDALQGGADGDELGGSSGDDDIDGGDGADRLNGGSGLDALDGDAGDDGLELRDGAADQGSCGAGNDRAYADSLDHLATDCEQDPATASPGGDGGGTVQPAPETKDQRPPAAFARLSHTVSGPGVLLVSVRCPKAVTGACRGSVSLRVGGRPIGSARFKVRSARVSRLRIELPAATRKRLAKGDRIAADVLLRTHDTLGRARSRSRRVILRGPGES